MRTRDVAMRTRELATHTRELPRETRLPGSSVPSTLQTICSHLEWRRGEPGGLVFADGDSRRPLLDWEHWLVHVRRLFPVSGTRVSAPLLAGSAMGFRVVGTRRLPQTRDRDISRSRLVCVPRLARSDSISPVQDKRCPRLRGDRRDAGDVRRILGGGARVVLSARAMTADENAEMECCADRWAQERGAACHGEKSS